MTTLNRKKSAKAPFPPAPSRCLGGRAGRVLSLTQRVGLPPRSKDQFLFARSTPVFLTTLITHLLHL